MTSVENVSGRLLIASPGLDDPNFKGSIVVVCDHSKDGAFGLVVNRILMDSFRPLLKTFGIERSAVDMPIFYGGPVRPEQGYVIYSPYDEKYGAIRVTDRLAVTSSKEILRDIAEDRGPDAYIFALGFAGWAPNQLEEELMTDSWLVAPVENDLIFSVPIEERWHAAALSIGVDLNRYINKSGWA